MAINYGFNESIVNGKPVFRFRIEDLTDGQKYSFAAGWEQGAKFYSLEKNGHQIVATAWGKPEGSVGKDGWYDNSVEARATGIKRAESAAKSKGKVVDTTKPVKPGLAKEKVSELRNHAQLVTLSATAGAKEGLDDETKKQIAMSALNVLVHIGYTDAEIKAMVKSFLAPSN